MCIKIEYRSFYRPSAIILLWLALFFANDAWAQKPTISAINKSNSEVDATILITGNNFGTDKNNIAVFFGGAKGEISTIANNQLEVKVPPSTTYDNISITNLTTGLTAYNKTPFFLSFGGSGFNSSPWSTQFNFQDTTKLNELCMCDFNGNGKLDIATANNASNFISIWRNTSNLSTINYSRTKINVLSPTFSVTCGDIDGDGKPDLVLSKDGTNRDRIFVLRNISTTETIAFASVQNYFTTNFGSMLVKLKDLDNDGKPDIILTDRTSTNNKIFIFKNSSVPGTISFDATAIELLSTAATSHALEVADLNGDGYPEIIISPEIGENVYVFTNSSSPGSISFPKVKVFTVPGS
ncbi:MAG: FG-GAP-like repeat-containing protein, partial [Bacteroidota bacterium]|nr:FG-GAP-like repeat-containing protein [Bacteroidota bacterium]